ncbi:MAG: hypothetical protein IPK32_10655 [Verrucomicrobiaceae bacterium]|nr:hypothetical protein [Verrucomicrobiaceae bacterium]
MPLQAPSDTIAHIRAAFPPQGFFADKEWRLSPQAFPLDAATLGLIRDLGPALRAFQRACNELYFDENHAWVAALLDQGKPEHVRRLGRLAATRHELPRVLRPDLVLTEDGVCISELDSLPGGIGLTAWLNQTYAQLGQSVIGGENGMLSAFAHAFPTEDILISRESGDYTPEMSWLAEKLGRRVLRPWELIPHEWIGGALYRFFELLTSKTSKMPPALLRMAERGELAFTPPLKAFLEEKLWLTLFWSPALESWWPTHLRPEHLQLLQRCIPRGWVVDPTPLPPHAVHPELDIHSWHELKTFGSRHRQLVLKISGFSERGWGSRGVFIGHDLPLDRWSTAIDEALTSFPAHPFVLQRFHHAKVIPHPVWDDTTQSTRPMPSRVRLCPYYFGPAESPDPVLGGILATVCPSDKKILHGMRDAMMLPVSG